MNKTFVMIHGSWHGGWAWQGVERELSKKGHRAQAPTLPGHGPGAMRLGVAHQDCVRSLVSYIQEQRLENVILVGHSFGGSIIPLLSRIYGWWILVPGVVPSCDKGQFPSPRRCESHRIFW